MRSFIVPICIALLALPVNSQAATICQYQTSSCESTDESDSCSTVGRWVTGRSLLTLIGAAAVGGAVGYATSINKHGSRGNQGAQGPQGPQGVPGAQGPAGVNPFVRDIDESIIFNTSITVTEVPTGQFIDLTVYAVDPEGTSVTVPIARINGPVPPNVVIPTVSIPFVDPVFGTYESGILAVPSAGNISFTYSVSAVATRNLSTTVLASGVVVPSFGAVGGGREYEFNLPFVYAIPPVP